MAALTFRLPMRMLRGPVGRSFLRLGALGLLWGAWWVWPERPLREVRISRVPGPPENATIEGNGQFVLLKSSEHNRVIRIADGKEMLSTETMRKTNISFDPDGRFIYFGGRSNYAVLDLANETIHSPRDFNYRTSEIPPPSFRDVIREKNRIDARVRSTIDTLNGASTLKKWLSFVLATIIGRDGFEVRTYPSGDGVRRLPGTSLVGFSDSEHAWTQQKDDGTIIVLNDWDVRDVSIPDSLLVVTILSLPLFLWALFSARPIRLQFSTVNKKITRHKGQRRYSMNSSSNTFGFVFPSRVW